MRTDAGQSSTGKPRLSSGHDAAAGVPRWQLGQRTVRPRAPNQPRASVSCDRHARIRKRHEFPHKGLLP